MSLIWNGGAMAAIDPAALAALSEVMVLDDYSRDLYVDLGSGLTSVDTRRSSAAEAGGLRMDMPSPAAELSLCARTCHLDCLL